MNVGGRSAGWRHHFHLLEEQISEGHISAGKYVLSFMCGFGKEKKL